MKTKRTLFIAGTLLLFPLITNVLLAQTTHRVPADFPKIQTAMDAAQEGDTVLVSPACITKTCSCAGATLC